MSTAKALELLPEDERQYDLQGAAAHRRNNSSISGTWAGIGSYDLLLWQLLAISSVSIIIFISYGGVTQYHYRVRPSKVDHSATNTLRFPCLKLEKFLREVHRWNSIPFLNISLGLAAVVPRTWALGYFPNTPENSTSHTKCHIY